MTQTHTTSSQSTTQSSSASDHPRFEDVIQNLQKIVDQLNQPNLNLDDALSLYGQGVHLADQGETLLINAEKQIESFRNKQNTRVSPVNSGQNNPSHVGEAE